ncbi:nitroreductase family protein [Gottschalkiaceae bacterium SANA]|nr:nitroreductase family protein [Gottschalkiaceae bacterium SANA]
MNPILQAIEKRQSLRNFGGPLVTDEEREAILHAALRAPTAGNMMMYSIVQIRSKETLKTLAETCDHQPFIGKASFGLLFLADLQKWHDYFCSVGLEKDFTAKELEPKASDLYLGLNDAIIAAQTAVIAAESLGVGSCYIGDIVENKEIHQEMFSLPRWVFPAAFLVFGKAPEGASRPMTPRFDEKYVVFDESYQVLEADDFSEMFARYTEKEKAWGLSFGEKLFKRKMVSDFAMEMDRSVRAYVSEWMGEEE